MRRPLVIGIGNSMRGDDGAGPFVARQLAALESTAYDVCEANGEMVSLMELWRDRSRVVLVDALEGGHPPGTVIRHDASDCPLPFATFSCSSHALGLAEAVELGRSLGRLPEEIVVFGIQGTCFEHGAPLSEPVREAATNLCDRIDSEVTRGIIECDNSSGPLDPLEAKPYSS